MRFQAQTFWLAKDADEPDQYQDAFELDAERGVAAIADGVSSAIFSGPWARILTQAVVVAAPPLEEADAFQAWLAQRRSAWADGIDASRLTWYQRPKMVEGAMTTLLWIELTPLETGDNGLAKSYRLRSFAIGDSCLFHIRGGETLMMFPLSRAEEFGLNPAVVGSVNRKLDHLLEFKAWETTCLPDDLIVLCTDAIALWACHEADAGRPVNWERYWNQRDDAWREEIFAHREASAMRFDDSTLLLLRVIEETAPQIVPGAEGSEPADVMIDAMNDELAQVDDPAALAGTAIGAWELACAAGDAAEPTEAIDLSEADEPPLESTADAPAAPEPADASDLPDQGCEG